MPKNQKKQTSSSSINDPKYAGKWIALSPDKKTVLGYAEKLDTLSKKIGDKDVIYTKGLHKDRIYVF